MIGMEWNGMEWMRVEGDVLGKTRVILVEGSIVILVGRVGWHPCVEMLEVVSI